MLQTPDGAETATRLCDLLRSRQQDIIDDWVQRVRSVSPAHDLPAPTLIDHLPRILTRMAAMMEHEPGATPVDLATMPESHAIDRLGRGFDLNDVVHEYALVRQCILDRWVREAGDFIRPSELRRLDAAVEYAVSQSISEYASARERLLRAVDRIADAALGSADVATFLHHLLRVTVETATAVDTVAVLLREGDLLRVRAATGLGREDELGFTLKIGEGFAGTIAAEGKPRALTAASDDTLLESPILRQRGIKALYGVPLVHNGEVIGVAHVGSTTAREFSDEDELLFRTMANRATAVIVQADLVERERQAHKELQATHARVLQIADSERQAREEMEAALAQVDSLLSASRHAEERQQFLAEASRSLGSSLDCSQVLATIARLSVPALGDSCVVYEVAENHLHRVTVQPGPLQSGPSAPLAIPAEIADLLHREGPRMYQPVPQALAMLLAPGTTGGPIVLAPLRTRQRPVGLLVIGAAPSTQERSPPAELIEEFARRAAIALDNAQLYRAAQRATATREQVLAIVSHDLKNPIAVIQMGAELLRRSDPAPSVRRQLDAIERSLETMNHLIADLLDMATIQGGHLAVNLEPGRADELVAEVITLHESLAAAHGIRLAAGSVSSELVVRADHQRLQQVFGNLVGNAIKFSPRDSTITVDAAARDSEVVFSVADQGPGVAPDEMSKIFEPYWSGQRHGKKSTGLGLFISQGIVRAHGGRIWVESQPGRGSTFHFALPLARPEPAPEYVAGPG